MLLVAQVALIAYMYRPNRTGGPPAVQFFKGITAEQVVGVAITDGTQSLALKKESKGWRIGTAPTYPAEAKKVEALVKKLLALSSTRLVARTDASHGRLKVAKDGYLRKLTLSMADGTSRELLLGTSPNYKTIHVRAADVDNVYLAKDLSDWEVSVAPEEWWDNNYVNVNPADLKSLILQNGHGRIELTRDGANRWQAVGVPAGKRLADEALNHFLNKACLVQLASYLGSEHSDGEFGLDKPLAELSLGAAGTVVHLKFALGDATKEEFVAKVSDSPFYVTVHAHEVKALLDATLDALLVDSDVGTAGKQ